MSNFQINPIMKHYEIVNTTKKLKRLRERMLQLSEYACFDGSTEILTEYGWMRFDVYAELKELPKVLSYSEGILQFKPVTKVIRKMHSGDMIRFQNKSMDMFMTPDHKVITYKGGKRYITRAEDIKLSEHHKIKVAGTRNLGIKSLSNIDRLLIAISADGHYVQGDGVFTFSFIKKRKIERLKYLLDSLALPYTSSTHQRSSKLAPDVSFRFKLPPYISFTKGLHNIVKLKDVSTAYAIEFLEEVSLWDGSYASNCSTSRSYNTTKKAEADFYSAMCVLGNSFSHKTVISNKLRQHEVNHKTCFKTGCNLNKSQVNLVGSLDTIKYEGEVFCLQVPDTQCFFARRGGGTPFLTHNCDTETNTLKVNGDNADFRLVGISISWGDYDNYYIPINHRRIEDRHNNVSLSDVTKYLKDPLEREDVRIIGANWKYDRHVLKRIGIDVNSSDVFDTMVASWLCDENNDKGLKPNALHRLKVKMTEFNEVIDIPNDIKKSFGLKANNKATFDLALIKDGAPYALADAFYTWKLYIGYIKELEDEGMLDIYNKKYIDFLDCLFWMEERGVVVDKEKLDWMSVEIAKDCDSLMYRMFELLGEEFNPNSGIQKAEILFGFEKQDSINKKSGKVTKAKPNYNLIAKNFGFKPISETPTGIPQVNNDVLFKIVRQYTQKPPRQQRKREGVEFCKLLSEYSGLQKLRSAFIEGSYDHMYDDGKVHPSFNAVGCVTGETLIPTDRGLVPIGNMSRTVRENFPEDFKINIVNSDMSLESTKYLVKFEAVPTVKITTSLGFTLEGSNIHPIMCNKYHRINNSHRYAKYLGTPECREWKKLEDLKVSDRVEIPIGFNVFGKDYQHITYIPITVRSGFKKATLPEILDEELAEFLGIWYADGSIHDGNGTFGIRITNGNTHVIDRVTYLSKKLFNLDASVKPEPKKNSATTYITAQALKPIEQALEMKRGCVNKIIPNIVLRSPCSVVKSFIKGMTLDSCIVLEKSSKKQYLKFTLSNEISARYLQEILLNIGIVSSRRQDSHKSNNVHYVMVHNGELIKFNELIGFVEKDQYVPIDKFNPNPSQNYTRVGNSLWLPIKSISHDTKDVYDFNVPNSHSFVSGAFISHNTDSGRIACKEPNLMQIPSSDDDSKYQIRDLYVGSIDPCTGERCKIISSDFSNLEVRVLTQFSNDEKLIEMFLDEQDVHGTTAVNMFELDCTPAEVKKKYPHLRQAAKIIGFLKPVA